MDRSEMLDRLMVLVSGGLIWLSEDELCQVGENILANCHNVPGEIPELDEMEKLIDTLQETKNVV